MWPHFAHHLLLHFPIALTCATAAVAVWSWCIGETPELRRLLRWAGWVTFAATTGTVLSGTWAAPGVLGGEGSEALNHHRYMGWTTWCVVGLAAWACERGERDDEAGYRRLAAGLWCVAVFSVLGTGHWGGTEEHPEVVPWLAPPAEQAPDAGSLDGGSHSDGTPPR